MKQLSIITLLLLASLMGACSSDDNAPVYIEEDYTSFINDYKYWRMTTSKDGAPEILNEGVQRFRGDTVIGNVTYRKFIFVSSDETKYLGAIREEGRKVYCVKAGQTQEHLAYDFGLQLGDKFMVTMAAAPVEATVTAVRMETTLKDGKRMQRCTEWILEADGIGRMTWTAGAGCTSGLLYEFGKVPDASALKVYLCSDTEKGYVYYYRGEQREDDKMPDGQASLSLIDEDKQWYVTGSDVRPYRHYYTSWFKGDTLIGNTTYHKYYLSRPDGSKSNYEAAFREDGKKVYCVKAGQTEEHLAYDFSLSLGDKFLVTMAPEPVEATVTSETIEYRLEGNRQVSRRLNFVLAANGIGSMTWVDGVGCTFRTNYYFMNRSGVAGGLYIYLCDNPRTGEVFYRRN